MAQNYKNIAPTKKDTELVYDFCIIGSGASGTIAAKEIISNGFSVLMLERGPFIRGDQNYDDILLASEPAYARQENGAWGLNGYPWTTCNVGGGTVFYGGISFRYREIDFDTSDFLNCSELAVKWPYEYSQLSPYYAEVENILGVSGNPLLDPYSPNDHHNLPNPPNNYSPQAEMLYEGASKLGLKPFPTPLAILSKNYSGRSKCNSCSPCIEQQCNNNSKSDSLFLLSDLLKKNKIRIFAGMNAIRLHRDRENNISTVECKDVNNGRHFKFKARCFLLACNAIQSARLLLNSEDQWSPKGIGNNYDMVGRALCQKLSGYVIGHLPSTSKMRKSFNNSGPFSTIAFTDYYQSSEFPFKLGGIIYEAKYGFSYSTPQSDSVIRLECLISDIPEKRNRVRINGLDNKVIIDYIAHPLDIVRLNILMKKAEEILKKIGCKEIFYEASGFGLGSCHLHGTCRYAQNEKQGVLDMNSQVYGVSNLYIIDGSFMPYPGSANPTLTIQAHALKTARAICKLYL